MFQHRARNWHLKLRLPLLKWFSHLSWIHLVRCCRITCGMLLILFYYSQPSSESQKTRRSGLYFSSVSNFCYYHVQPAYRLFFRGAKYVASIDFIGKDMLEKSSFQPWCVWFFVCSDYFFFLDFYDIYYSCCNWEIR